MLGPMSICIWRGRFGGFGLSEFYLAFPVSIHSSGPDTDGLPPIGNAFQETARCGDNETSDRSRSGKDETQ
jgi:hypothetical protein